MADSSRRQVKITCPVCGQHLDVTELPAFEIVNCVKCGEKLLVPMQLGNYRLLSTIGGGGMGMVYRAVDISLGRQVAVKLLRKDLAESKSFIETFTREARAVAALNHPNIATLYSFGVEEGQYYLVMELVPRGSLDDMITKRKRIPEAETLEIGMQVASGLRHAYQRGLIHRDIKPGNILFSEAGMPKVVDFGLAEFHTEAKTPQKDGIWGTPYYIAPEKVAGEKEDFRSDIYSLGGTLFHALAGRAPFEANTATDVVIKNLTTPALSLKTFAPDITDETARAVGRMLIKNRAARYSSYDTLIHDLQLAKQHLTTQPIEKHLVSVNGGNQPIWSANGREIFYRAGQKFFAVTVTSLKPFRTEAPRLLFETNKYSSTSPVRGWDASGDGQRFLLTRIGDSGDRPVTDLQIVLNWDQELKRRVPAK